MPTDDHESDVLIVGAGPTGLYAALLLSQLNISVRIIDKASASGLTNSAFLWSPRSLQLLQYFDLVNKINEFGVRHWRFETCVHKGYGSNAMVVERQQHRVWENESTEFDWSLSCECHQVCQVLTEALQARGVRVHYGHQLMDFEDVEQVRNEAPYHLDSGFAHDVDKCTIATIHDTRENYTYDWKAKAVIGADGANSFVRQKLGLAQERRKTMSVFYTLEATVNTNFPGTRVISTVVKNQNALFIVGHRDRLYFIFEHSPKWSRLTVDDDVPLAMAKRHIRSILEPNHIEFVKVHGYHRWSGDSKACEAFSVDRRYFLAGAAAQSIYPEGLLMGDVGLEQANNLCWKLFLHLKLRASPMLIDTYESESRSKLADTREASHTLLHLISNHQPPSGAGFNSTLTRELGYHLNKNKHSLVGETPYHSNLINQGTASMLSVDSSADTIKSAMMVTEKTQKRLHPGAPGTLALNAKLKPYTLLQLLMIQLSKIEEKPATPTETYTSTPPSERPPRINGLNGTRKPRTRSNSESNMVGQSWFAPFLQSVTRKNSTAGRPPSGQDSQTAASSAATAYIERWRGIKPTYYQLLDRMSQNRSPTTFTVLIFCGPLADRENLAVLQRLKRRLESPQSFIQRYEMLLDTQSQYPTASSPTSPVPWAPPERCSSPPPPSDPFRTSFSSSHRSSISTIVSAASLFQTSSTPTFNGGRLSLDQTRPSFESSVYSDLTTLSASPTPPLFAFTYITSSSKNEANKFLANTKPALVQSLFSLGLDKVYLDHDGQAHMVYNINQPTAVIIRPDGYIGTRASLMDDTDMDKLDQYFDSFLRPAVDMSSAAALAADYYDY